MDIQEEKTKIRRYDTIERDNSLGLKLLQVIHEVEVLKSGTYVLDGKSVELQTGDIIGFHKIVPELPFAEKLYDARSSIEKLEDEFYDVLTKLGIDGFDEFTYDYYDTSFELVGCKVGLEFTDEQLRKFKELGFDRCWINYKEGEIKEKYYNLRDLK